MGERWNNGICDTDLYNNNAKDSESDSRGNGDFG